MNAHQLAARLSAAASEFKPATELMRAVGRVLSTSVKAQIRAKAYKTGRLHGSVVERVIGGEAVSVEATAEYARYVDEGTRYMEGRHFMAGGLQDALPGIDQELQKWGETVLGKVGG